MVFTLAVAGLILTGCAGSKQKLTSESMPDTFACVDDDGKVEKMIAAEAELAEFSCSIKNGKVRKHCISIWHTPAGFQPDS